MIATRSVNETWGTAEKILKKAVRSRGKNHALIFAFCGELGSGKTSFTQGIARALGVREPVISPTFVLLRVYKIRKLGFKRLVHIDCYRLKDERELETLGWNDMIKDGENIIVVEWAEKVRSVLPEESIEICFGHIGGTERKIEIMPKSKDKN